MTSSAQGTPHIITTVLWNCKLFCLVFGNNKRKLIVLKFAPGKLFTAFCKKWKCIKHYCWRTTDSLYNIAFKTQAGTF